MQEGGNAAAFSLQTSGRLWWENRSSSPPSPLVEISPFLLLLAFVWGSDWFPPNGCSSNAEIFKGRATVLFTFCNASPGSNIEQVWDGVP